MADPIPVTENLIVFPIMSILTGGAVEEDDPTNPLDAVTILLKEIVSVVVLTPIYSPSCDNSLLRVIASQSPEHLEPIQELHCHFL